MFKLPRTISCCDSKYNNQSFCLNQQKIKKHILSLNKVYYNQQQIEGVVLNDEGYNSPQHATDYNGNYVTKIFLRILF